MEWWGGVGAARLLQPGESGQAQPSSFQRISQGRKEHLVKEREG